MSHELYAHKITGQIPMAFTGARSAIWHGLGQQLEAGKSIDDWVGAAGFNWNISTSDAHFQDDAGAYIAFPGKMVLRRSDTQEPLSIVSDSFKVVQPKQVLEFFRDLTAKHGMRLSTAGILGNGKRFWALADCGLEDEVVGGDKVKGQLLLTSSADGQQSTTAKFVSTRVVCQNTLDVALKGGGKMVRVTHKKEFDADQVKIDLGILEKSWVSFMDNLKKLSSKPMGDGELRTFVSSMFYDANRAEDAQTWGVERLVEAIITKAKAGSGADMHKGTRWGALCGITEVLTHKDTSKVSSENRFTETFLGMDANTKASAYFDLLMMA